MSKGQNTQFEVSTAPQLRLFESQLESSPITQGTMTERRFRDPDPREIFLGERRLNEYLRDAKLNGPLLVREVLRKQDFSAFEASYSAQGRAPYAPAAMLGLILWGLMHGVSSLRALELMARTDLGCMWVSGGIAPEFSVIGRFFRRHEDLFRDGKLFAELTATVVEVCGSDLSELAGDGTIIQAAVARGKYLNAEAARLGAQEAAERSDENPDDDDLRQEKERAEEVATEVEARAEKRKEKGKDPSKALISPKEPEAYVVPQKQGGVVAPSFKPSIFANKDRIIASCAVHPSSETAVLEELIEKAIIAGAPLTYLLLDGNYLSNAVLKLGEDNGIEMLIPTGKTSTKNGKFTKEVFEADEGTDTLTCPARQTLHPIYRGKASGGKPPYVAYGNAPCEDCALRADCTDSHRGRAVKLYENEEYRIRHRKRMKRPESQEKYQKRKAWVEPPFGELKEIQNLKRFRRSGLRKVQAEFSLHAMAHNLRRMLVLVRANPALLAPLLALYALFRTFLGFSTARQGSEARLALQRQRT